ncbi:helix-turn-helix domain-containing protein [Sphingomonas sp.]|jgi:transcriptional regulator with XRE-family HTH domain|uniref:helix-turn-helix domain-containing protein n=1 Tax=Sphingomonas sp. TaxID=28214 RepID=UPI00262E5957|nr:helix-turn-helix domain-containing protein [Sphingomonas sp.]MDF2493624.1 helix-turn-helix protein [Sphingomonas sp.]
MTEAERGDNATLFPQPVGERLRAAREQQGMSLAEIGARTRVPLRHLEAIEASNYGALPSPTYAVGFVRAYARAVGEDEVVLARDVRVEALKSPRTTPQYQPYEIADPARVPSRGMVVVAAGLALAVAVLAVLWFASGLFHGEGDAPAASPSVAVAVPAAQPTQVPRRADQVSLVATDEVWLRVYDAADKTLYLGTMKPGERYDVPADANDPKINVGRPDKLQVTLNGSALPPLGSGARPIKDVPVGAAALAARIGGEGAPAPAASPTASPAVAGARTSAAVPPAFATSDAAAGAAVGAGTSVPAN